jgi:general secretion pathway protein M
MKSFQALLAARWNAMASRERLLVGCALALLAVALLWWVAISPALSQIKQAQQLSPQLDAQLQLMRTQAQEAASLKGQRQLSYDESLRGLEASIKTLGAGALLSVSDARASVTLKGTNGDALAQWLAQVRTNARLVPSELRLQKSPAASASTGASATAMASWDGTVVLNLPAR